MHALEKIAALWTSLSLLAFLLALPTESPAAEGNEIRLQWAFGALTGPQDNPQLLSIEENAVLHSGDRIKMFLQPQTDCHLYLFYRSSQEDLVVMLPAEGSPPLVAAGVQHMVPGGSRWFQLDEFAGVETFYLLVSARPLQGLEALRSSLSTASAQAKREAVGREILSEINRLHNKRRTLTAAAERPIRIGGNLRGLAEDSEPQLPDINRIAVEITASDFYSRTFTIDHR